ncbi:MAG: NAD(P)(+) transhydrogenase (Re/Si-specific) subunit alpha, partial [Alphaproteobacteria bacterium]
MLIGVPKESMSGEPRVALVPATIPALTKAGLTVRVEKGAGA